MTPPVAAAVLLAAVTHACWNALAHQITDKLLGFTLITGGGAVIGLALVPFTALPKAAAWPYLATSALIHLAYTLLLMKSFRLGDFGQAYPIARGTAPLVVTVFAAVFAHEVPDGWAAANGETNINELTLACGPDNRLVEEGGWTTRKRKDGRTEWIPPPHLDTGQSRVNDYHHPEKYLVDPEGEDP